MWTYWSGAELIRRCGSCDADMALMEERVQDAGVSAFCGVRAWGCRWCGQQAESFYIVTWLDGV